MTKRRRPATAAKDPNALVPHASVLALDPLVLHDQAEASVRALLQEGESANTVRSYGSALRYWAAWFRLRYRAAIALPVPVPAVLQFLVDHVQRTAPEGLLVHDLPLAIDHTLVDGAFKGELGAPALNTVLHRLSVLSKAHQMSDVLNPTRDPAVQELVRRIRRAYAARGERPASKTALTKDPLEAMLATCTSHRVENRVRRTALAAGGRTWPPAGVGRQDRAERPWIHRLCLCGRGVVACAAGASSIRRPRSLASRMSREAVAVACTSQSPWNPC
jgi:hypothetical protein